MRHQHCQIISALLTALFAAGCGPSSLSHTVDPAKLRDMSRRGQLTIYDTENGIIVALDRLDEARDKLHRVRRQIHDAEDQVEAAEKRQNRLAVKTAEAWLVHLEALERWCKANIRLQRLGILKARAEVELAKAQVIQREDLLGGKDFAVKTFVEQLQQLTALFKRRQKSVDRLRTSARKKEHRWWRLRQRYVAQTGDNDRGLWIGY